MREGRQAERREALSATTARETTAPAALGKRMRSWYKAPAARVRIITIDRERHVAAHASATDSSPMKPGFYTLLTAQFFSSLADNALLIAAIALLRELHEPAWMTPALKQSFVVSYVVLAPLVGAFADSMAKGRVMLVTNTIKIVGCALMLLDVHPLLAIAVVGFGAASYSPAKYGILTELLPPQQLVVANGWMEGATVASIILGFLLGGVLITPRVSATLLGFDFPVIDLPIDTPPEAAIVVIIGFYVIAAIFNWYIPDTGVDHRLPSKNPLYLVREFSHCVALLWRDRLGQISLATTTLFWGAGATLQFIVIDWAARALSLNLSQAAMLQGVVALGIALGAMLAARFVSLRGAVGVLPIGAVMGAVVMVMVFVHYIPIAMLLMVAIGACAGFFVVPMNALLQHRGHVLMGAGHSIAVQNFNENIGILVMVGLYALMVRAGLSVGSAIILFGLSVTSAMLLVMWRHRANQREFDSLHLIGIDKPQTGS
jgi:LPLT family lysophospholipid transporter-like MFS transporter